MNETDGRPLVSIIIPALNEAASVPDLLKRFCEFPIDHADYDFELVVVDDGSTDETAKLVIDLAPVDERITVVRLSRNFGSHNAISAGLAACWGDCAVVLGADLQEPPSLLADFLSRWRDGSEVVWGIRRSRAGRSAVQELSSKAFSLLFTRYANLENYPAEGPSGVLADRVVIDELNQMKEQNRNTLALIAWLGFTQTQVEYDQEARVHGDTRWTKRKMFKLAMDSLIQFSSMPLRACTFTGTTASLLGLLYALVLVIQSMAGVATPSGWPTILVVMLLMGGAQLAVIGILGEYLWRGVEEARRRPLYVTRSVHTSGPDRPMSDRALAQVSRVVRNTVPANRAGSEAPIQLGGQSEDCR